MEYEGCTEQAERIKSLLHGSSSKNPTCVLGTVLADFKSQGNTELTVCAGEEIYILFEINDWAFVTCFTETSRRGYVPLDYCNIITDFYTPTKSSRSNAGADIYDTNQSIANLDEDININDSARNSKHTLQKKLPAIYKDLNGNHITKSTSHSAAQKPSQIQIECPIIQVNGCRIELDDAIKQLRSLEKSLSNQNQSNHSTNGHNHVPSTRATYDTPSANGDTIIRLRNGSLPLETVVEMSECDESLSTPRLSTTNRIQQLISKFQSKIEIEAQRSQAAKYYQISDSDFSPPSSVLLETKSETSGSDLSELSDLSDDTVPHKPAGKVQFSAALDFAPSREQSDTDITPRENQPMPNHSTVHNGTRITDSGTELEHPALPETTQEDLGNSDFQQKLRAAKTAMEKQYNAIVSSSEGDLEFQVPRRRPTAHNHPTDRQNGTISHISDDHEKECTIDITITSGHREMNATSDWPPPPNLFNDTRSAGSNNDAKRDDIKERMQPIVTGKTPFKADAEVGTEPVRMNDSATQTSPIQEPSKTSRNDASKRKNKYTISRQGSAFSRNSRARQSQLHMPSPEHPNYLLQPISPASLTDQYLPEAVTPHPHVKPHAAEFAELSSPDTDLVLSSAEESELLTVSQAASPASQSVTLSSPSSTIGSKEDRMLRAKYNGRWSGGSQTETGSSESQSSQETVYLDPAAIASIEDDETDGIYRRIALPTISSSSMQLCQLTNQMKESLRRRSLPAIAAPLIESIAKDNSVLRSGNSRRDKTPASDVIAEIDELPSQSKKE